MMPNSATTQSTADNAITSDRSSVAPNKTFDVSTEKLVGEKPPSTDTPCITIPFKNVSASEQGQVNVHFTIKDSFNKTECQLSETLPVSPDVLQRLQTQLTACYTKTSFLNKRLFDTDYFSLADYFVNLQVVVQANKINEVMQSGDDKRSHKPLRACDRLVGEKEVIAPGDLFQPSKYQDANGKSPLSIDTVVVSGAAGVGKTTLMDYLAYQWALFKQGVGKAGLWSNFETVLIVRCRDLQSEALGLGTQTKDIAELLRCVCWGQLDICLDEARQLLRTLKSAPESCLLLLDGLDELPVPKKTYWHNLLVQLFQLPFKKLVTTRPYAIGNLPQWLRHDGLVEIQGFSNEEVPTFFKKHLGATERTNNFIKDIKQNPDLWAIVHIPINAYLLKIWWETTYQQDRSVLLSEMSVSHLYESLMVNVCRRYLAKIGELDENKLLDDEMILEVPSIRCLLDTLGCWAFEGLRQDTAQLPIGWLKGVQGSDDSPTLLSANRLKQFNVPTLKALGLLKHVGCLIKAQEQYEFLHLSFQEFLAARVIAERLREGAEEQTTHLMQVIHRYKYHLNFTLVWPAVAGLLKGYPTVLNDFLSMLVAGSKDWVGFVEADLLMRCLESSLPSSTDAKALGLQETLLWAIKQRIKQLNELPQAWQEATIDTLSMCPKLIRLNANTVWALLQNAKVIGFIRGKLASSAVAYWSRTPELVDAVLTLLRDGMVNDYFRRALAESVAVHWSKVPECADAVWVFLRDEQVNEYVRGRLVGSVVTHLSQTTECMNTVLALLRARTVSSYVRFELASSAIMHWSRIPKCVDAVWAFLRDQTLDSYFRRNLASSAVAHLSHTPELVDALLVFLQDEQVDEDVRGTLAIRAGAHVSQTPEYFDKILAFLRDKQECGDIHVALAISTGAYLSKVPERVDAVWAFLRDEAVMGSVRRALASSAVSYLAQTPELLDALLMFLRDETVRGSIRGTLAVRAVAHLSHTPELVDALLVFLRDEQVDEGVRRVLAENVIKYWSQTAECADAVWVFLRDGTVNEYVRGDLAISAAAHWSHTPELVSAVLALRRDKTVGCSVRWRLVLSAVAHVSQTSELGDVVWASLRDGTVNEYVRGELAVSAGAHVSQIPKYVDAVWALLRDETVNNHVRSKLAINAVAHLSHIPECVDVILALLRDEQVGKYIRRKLARHTIQQLLNWPNKAQAFLDSLFVKDRDGDDRSQHVDIPVYLLLPLYKKTHDKGRQYIREQLLKHRVLVYEQAGTVLVTQAGQTEKLTLPRPLIQQIQKDMQPYRINMDDSANLLAKLSLFSQSVMSFFSSQDTEKSSGQTSRSNIGCVMQ